jgi:hypothetical protein
MATRSTAMDEDDRVFPKGVDVMHPFAFNALSVVVIGILFLLAASWLVLVSSGLFALVDWLTS